MDSYSRTLPYLPYPIGIALIAGLLLYGAVMKLVSLRHPWDLAFCGLYIVLGIGMLKMYQWARVATIVVAALDVAYFGFALMTGVRYWHPMFSLSVFSKFLFYLIIVCYLLSPKIKLAYTRPVARRIGTS